MANNDTGPDALKSPDERGVSRHPDLDVGPHLEPQAAPGYGDALAEDPAHEVAEPAIVVALLGIEARRRARPERRVDEALRFREAQRQLGPVAVLLHDELGHAARGILAPRLDRDLEGRAAVSGDEFPSDSLRLRGLLRASWARRASAGPQFPQRIDRG